MLRVGITGGIGSGKSIVAKVFATLGIPVYNADSTAKRLMEEDTSLKASISLLFGEQAYEAGRLNRPYISAIVFKDREKLAQLNALVHPATIAAGEKWFGEQQAPYALKEAALIFESGTQRQLDFVIGVSAPQHLRIHRVMARDGVGREEVLKRMQNQIDETIKMRLCDSVIYNDEVQLVIPQVLELHEQLLKISSER